MIRKVEDIEAREDESTEGEDEMMCLLWSLKMWESYC